MTLLKSHDSSFFNNLVMVEPYDGSNCVNMTGFKQGVGDAFYNNTCISGIGQYDRGSGCGSPACANHSHKVPAMDVVGQVSQCDTNYTHLGRNRYFTPHGNASLNCGGRITPLDTVKQKFGNEVGSNRSLLPTAEEALGGGGPVTRVERRGW